jgi:hypothetical protein
MSVHHTITKVICSACEPYCYTDEEGNEIIRFDVLDAKGRRWAAARIKVDCKSGEVLSNLEVPVRRGNLGVGEIVRWEGAAAFGVHPHDHVGPPDLMEAGYTSR